MVPYEGRWTAPQLLRHVTKPILRIAQALYMDANPTGRNPGLVHQWENSGICLVHQFPVLRKYLQVINRLQVESFTQRGNCPKLLYVHEK